MVKGVGPWRAQYIIDRSIRLQEAEAVAFGRAEIALAPEARARTKAAHARLQEVIAQDRHVYGLTTGFGPLANRLISKDDGANLQQNLIYHLASGIGAPLAWAEARMMVLARLMSILQGLSGASEAAISRMLALLASPFAPRVPARGTVGASGDLTPLAHMVLALQGQSGFIDSAGAPVDRATALDALGGPLDLRARDGLALVNGTSAMTGVAVLNVCAMARAQSRALAQSAVLAEVFGARMEAWHPLFAQVRPHAGQLWACEQLSALTLDAPRVAREFVALRVLSGAAGAEPAALQDAYSLRCVPQLVGAAYDTAAFHQRVVECELSSVTDNPIFPDPALAPPAPALHGGNFMGMHVGLASDALAGAVLTLANLAERQIARLTDERLNAGLYAFLHDGPCGLNSGFMGAQVTTSALLAEMRAIGPAAIQSI